MAAIVRVKRKRSADPGSSLVLAFKRSRPQDYDPEQVESTASDIIQEDFCWTATCDANQLAFNDAVKHLIEPNIKVNLADMLIEKDKALSISEVLLMDVDEQMTIDKETQSVSNDDFVYDFYLPKAKNEVLFGTDYFNGLVGGVMNCDQPLVNDGDDSDVEVVDDEDDSNDENNWRNDYPDEESDVEYDSDSARYREFEKDEEQMTSNFDQLNFGDDDDDNIGTDSSHFRRNIDQQKSDDSSDENDDY